MSATDFKPSERVLRIRRAAVRFANDYGPLPAANAGDEDAQHQVAGRLYRACRDSGLKIILDPESN